MGLVLTCKFHSGNSATSDTSPEKGQARKGRRRLKNMRHRSYLFSIDFTLLMLVLIIASCPQTEDKRRPVRYWIPAGYTGWVKINFRVPNAPALPMEDGNYVAQIPANAQLETSSDIEYGTAKDEYYYYETGGKRPLKHTTFGGGGMIWGGFNGQQSKQQSGGANILTIFCGYRGRV